MFIEQLVDEIETMVKAVAKEELIDEGFHHEITCDLLNQLRAELVRRNLIA